MANGYQLQSRNHCNYKTLVVITIAKWTFT